MQRRAFLAGLGLLACFGCGPLNNTNAFNASSGSTGGVSGVDGTSNLLQVTTLGTQYIPNNLVIMPGQKVTWVNQDAVAHTVTAGLAAAPTGQFDQTLQPRESVSVTFDQPGTYQFFCKQHAAEGMVGSVTVKGAGGSTTGGSALGR